MKKLSFLMLLCCSLWAAVSMAQNDQKPRYTSFEEGRILSRWSDYSNYPTISYVDSIGGDTIVQGKTYKKVWSWSNAALIWPDDPKYKDGIKKTVRHMVREEGSRIYYRYHAKNTEYLVFDYNWVPRDTIVFENIGHAGRTDTTFLTGYIYDVQTLKQRFPGSVFTNLDDARTYDIHGALLFPEYNPPYYFRHALYFIEGIGLMDEGFNLDQFTAFDIFAVGGVPSPHGYNYIRSGNGTVYVDNGYGLYYPQEPIRTAIGEVEASPILKPDGPIYDLNGRRLSTVPDKGLYIRNGQLKVAR